MKCKNKWILNIFKWTFFYFHLLSLDKWDWCKTGTLKVRSCAIKVIVNRIFWINYYDVKKIIYIYNLLHYCLSVFIGSLFIFSPDFCPPFSVWQTFVLPSPCGLQSALRLFEFDMHRRVKTLVTLRSYKPCTWVL